MPYIELFEFLLGVALFLQVHANEVWIEMDNVEKGIVEIIAQHDVRWLVMGAAADEYYTEYYCLAVHSYDVAVLFSGLTGCCVMNLKWVALRRLFAVVQLVMSSQETHLTSELQ